MTKKQKLEMQLIVEAMLRDIKALSRTLRMDLPVPVMQEIITRICELVKDLETVTKEIKDVKV